MKVEGTNVHGATGDRAGSSLRDDGRRCRRAPWCIGLLLLSMWVACSVPLSRSRSPELRELVFGYHSFASAAARTRRVTVGIDFRVQERVAGMALGWSDLRILDVAGREVGVQTCDAGFVWPLGIRLSNDDGACASLGWFFHAQAAPGRSARVPSFTHQIGVGALFDWSGVHHGVSVGYSSTTQLRAAADSCGAYLLRYRSRSLARSLLRSLTKEEKACEIRQQW